MVIKRKILVTVNALKALKVKTARCNPMLVYIISSKFDKFMKKAWEETIDDRHEPTFEELVKFMNKKERGNDESI